MWCVESAANVFVPVKNNVDSTYNVPGWNEMYRISILKPVGVVLTSAAGYKVVSLVVGTCFNSCRELELILSSLYR